MSDAPIITRAQDALVELLRRALPALEAARDLELPRADLGEYGFLNVVLSGKPPEVQAECMGLAEDEVEIEFVQTINIEWIVRDEDPVRLADVFDGGLKAINAALVADRTLGGVARGLTIGPPTFEGPASVASPATRACLIPCRVALTGATLIS